MWRNLHAVAHSYSFLREPEFTSFRRRKLDCRRSRNRRRIEENEIELFRGESFGVPRVQQVEIYQHQLAVADLSEGLEHQVHPKALPCAVDLLTDCAGLPA